MGHQVTSVGLHALVYMPRHDAKMPIIMNMVWLFYGASRTYVYLDIKSAPLIMSFVMSLTLRLNKNFNAYIKLAFAGCDYVYVRTCSIRVRFVGALDGICWSRHSSGMSNKKLEKPESSQIMKNCLEILRYPLDSVNLFTQNSSSKNSERPHIL